MNAPANSALALIDGISLDFEKLEGIIGVCRVAARAGGEAEAMLGKDDLPDALYAARELAASLKARVDKLSGFALSSRDGCVPDAVEARR